MSFLQLNLRPALVCLCDNGNAETVMASFPPNLCQLSSVLYQLSCHISARVGLESPSPGLRFNRPWLHGCQQADCGTVAEVMSIQCLCPSCDFAPFRPLLISPARWECAVGELKRCWLWQRELPSNDAPLSFQVRSEIPRGGICDGASVGQTHPKYRDCIFALPQHEPIRNAPRKRTRVPGGGAKAVTVLACT